MIVQLELHLLPLDTMTDDREKKQLYFYLNGNLFRGDIQEPLKELRVP